MDDEPDRTDERDRRDRGHGDETLFPAEDLEKLYRLGAASDMKIRGDALNYVMQTDKFAAKSWYLVTEKGVKRL